MPQVTSNLSNALYKSVRSHSKAQHLSIAEIVRRSIEYYLDNHETLPDSFRKSANSYRDKIKDESLDIDDEQYTNLMNEVERMRNSVQVLEIEGLLDAFNDFSDGLTVARANQIKKRNEADSH